MAIRNPCTGHLHDQEINFSVLSHENLFFIVAAVTLMGKLLNNRITKGKFMTAVFKSSLDSHIANPAPIHGPESVNLNPETKKDIGTHRETSLV